MAKAEGAGGLAGWRWIFLSEGLITCAVALLSIWLLPDFPPDTKLFQGIEKAVLLERLRQDGSNEQTDEIWESVQSALLDWKIWLA